MVSSESWSVQVLISVVRGIPDIGEARWPPG